MANLISVTQLAEANITTILLRRQKSEPNSLLRGAAVDADTQETLFMMTATTQQIYSLDLTQKVLPSSEGNTIPLHGASLCVLVGLLLRQPVPTGYVPSDCVASGCVS